MLFPQREAPDPELTCFLFLPGSKWAFCRVSISGGVKSNFLFTIKGTESGSAENAHFFSAKSEVKEQVSGWQIKKEVRRGWDTPSASWLGAEKELLFRTCAGQIGEYLQRTGERAEPGAGTFANLGQWRLLHRGGWGQPSPDPGWAAESGVRLSGSWGRAVRRQKRGEPLILPRLVEKDFSPHRRNYSPTIHSLKTLNGSITSRKLHKPLV